MMTPTIHASESARHCERRRRTVATYERRKRQNAHTFCVWGDKEFLLRDTGTPCWCSLCSHDPGEPSLQQLRADASYREQAAEAALVEHDEFEAVHEWDLSDERENWEDYIKGNLWNAPSYLTWDGLMAQIRAEQDYYDELDYYDSQDAYADDDEYWDYYDRWEDDWGDEWDYMDDWEGEENIERAESAWFAEREREERAEREWVAAQLQREIEEWEDEQLHQYNDNELAPQPTNLQYQTQ